MDRRCILLVYFVFHAFVLLGGEGTAVTKNELLKKVKEATQDTARVKWLVELCWNEYEHNNFDSAFTYALKSTQLAERSGDLRCRSASLQCLGSVYFRRANYDKALESYEKGFELAEKAGDKKFQAKLLNNLAVVYKNQGDYAKSLQHHLRSLGIKEGIGDKEGAASSEYNIGVVFYLKGDMPGAVEHFNKAKEYYERTGSKPDMSAIYNALANIYADHGKRGQALDFYTKSLKIREELEDKLGIAVTLNNIGIIYKEQGDSLKAAGKKELALEKYMYSQKNYSRSLDIKTELADSVSICSNLLNLGELQLAIGNTEKAREYLQMALATARMIGSREDEQVACGNLARLFAGTGDYKKAYEYFRIHAMVKDSLLNTENSRQINEMEAKYETEKKDKELLRKDLEIGRQQAETRQQLFQRNAFIIGFTVVALLALFIFRGYRQKQRANVAISMQKEIIEEKNKEITDSIHYAQRIQNALLASGKLLKANLPEHFILYKPKDIVSGDFYWAALLPNGNFMLCAADCTGHGVPGAFMSLLNVSFLNESIAEKKLLLPGKILGNVREQIIAALNPEGAETQAKDGMDCVLCSFDFKAMRLEFSGANNPLWVVRKGGLIELEPDKMPVGMYSKSDLPFHTREMDLQKGDTIYMFTDGYADQFGGPKGKKFKYKQLMELLLEVQGKDMELQKEELDSTIERWRGGLEQVDDILVIGVRV